MIKPETIDEAKELLADLAVFLDKHYSRPFASNAIQSYLNGTAPSLDHAFGLVRSRGAQKRDSMHRNAVIRAIDMRLEGKTWKRICNELPFDDERELRRMCVKSFAEVASNMLAAELKADSLGV
jgi:hypothetical protein